MKPRESLPGASWAPPESLLGALRGPQSQFYEDAPSELIGLEIISDPADPPDQVADAAVPDFPYSCAVGQHDVSSNETPANDPTV